MNQDEVDAMLLENEEKISEKRKKFEENLRNYFQGATVYLKGKLILGDGFRDEEWWRNKVEKAWENRGKYNNMHLRS